MHDMIDRREWAFLLGLARSRAGVHGGRLDFSRTRCDTGFELMKALVLQGIMRQLTIDYPSRNALSR
jgi:hypothetical protein